MLEPLEYTLHKEAVDTYRTMGGEVRIMLTREVVDQLGDVASITVTLAPTVTYEEFVRQLANIKPDGYSKCPHCGCLVGHNPHCIVLKARQVILDNES